MDPPRSSRHPPLPEETEAVVAQVGEAIGDVRTELGAGLLENVYKQALHRALVDDGLRVEREVRVPVMFRGHKLGTALRLDLLVEGQVVVEAKAIKELAPIHFAQVLTYVRLARKPIGILANFHAIPLGPGIRRLRPPAHSSKGDTPPTPSPPAP